MTVSAAGAFLCLGFVYLGFLCLGSLCLGFLLGLLCLGFLCLGFLCLGFLCLTADDLGSPMLLGLPAPTMFLRVLSTAFPCS